ncbi:MAG: hypothetical protein HY318_14475 [Armatimonadetes bacterium]|nr:hypothetical protein [Armatimonadota bacterium]
MDERKCVVRGILSVSIPLLLAGCGSGSGFLPRGPTEAAVITDVRTTPATLPRFTGGPVTITATVRVETSARDFRASGLTIVTVITQTRRKSDGQVLPEVSLEPQEGSDTYAGVVTAPANTRNDGANEEYLITLTVTDSREQLTTATDAATFSVPPPAGGIPDPPF